MTPGGKIKIAIDALAFFAKSGPPLDGIPRLVAERRTLLADFR